MFRLQAAIVSEKSTVFSPPEPLWLIGELIVYSCSVVVVFDVVNHFQTSSPPKPFRQSKPNFMWSLLGKGKPKFVKMVQVT